MNGLHSLYLNFRTDPYTTVFRTQSWEWVKEILEKNACRLRVNEIYISFEFKDGPRSDFLDRLAVQIVGWAGTTPQSRNVNEELTPQANARVRAVYDNDERLTVTFPTYMEEHRISPSGGQTYIIVKIRQEDIFFGHRYLA
ncbi:hypothetical protein MMC11_001117 [Xylographa trunciseda]|nr:hypothetical protein [Xylographa trunciseda]